MLSVLFSTEACYTIKENDKTFFFPRKKNEFCVYVILFYVEVWTYHTAPNAPAL